MLAPRAALGADRRRVTAEVADDVLGDPGEHSDLLGGVRPMGESGFDRVAEPGWVFG